MTRLGWLLLLVFVVIIGAFALMVQWGGVRQVAQPEISSAGPVATPSRGGGGLIIPVAGVSADRLADTWGDARGEGARQHHAIDIMAPRGTPVLAAAAGTVEKLFESHDGGHTAYVRRTDPAWQDYYAHLDAYVPDLREGITVRQGQQIGTVGSSGDADPGNPHLHFEIHKMAPGEQWWKGREVNPYPVLKGLPG